MSCVGLPPRYIPELLIRSKPNRSLRSLGKALSAAPKSRLITKDDWPFSGHQLYRAGWRYGTSLAQLLRCLVFKLPWKAYFSKLAFYLVFVSRLIAAFALLYFIKLIVELVAVIISLNCFSGKQCVTLFQIVLYKLLIVAIVSIFHWYISHSSNNLTNFLGCRFGLWLDFSLKWQTNQQ